MPIYEYKCAKCGKKFELFRNMSDREKETRCPGCGAESVERIFSLFGTMLPGIGCFPGDIGGG
jgi:putative FmdB family regulatory protein